MTYNFNIDQEFAIVNDLTLTQVTTLAAFMTLPIWAKTVAIDGAVWYQYSDEKMAEDFPLLFGVSKRCYKNITELCGLGFVELTKLGRTKYVRFTERCADWGKEKDQKRTNSPKTDAQQSEIGPIDGQNSPKTDQPNNNYNTNIPTIKDNTGGLFESEQDIKIVTHPRRTSEPLCLFADSRYFPFDKFVAEFDSPEFAEADFAYYYHAVADWSARYGRKQKDWIATARNFMRNDRRDGKLVKANSGAGALGPDAIEYLNQMADAL